MLFGVHLAAVTPIRHQKNLQLHGEAHGGWRTRRCDATECECLVDVGMVHQNSWSMACKIVQLRVNGIQLILITPLNIRNMVWKDMFKGIDPWPCVIFLDLRAHIRAYHRLQRSTSASLLTIYIYVAQNMHGNGHFTPTYRYFEGQHETNHVVLFKCATCLWLISHG